MFRTKKKRISSIYDVNPRASSMDGYTGDHMNATHGSGGRHSLITVDYTRRLSKRPGL